MYKALYPAYGLHFFAFDVILAGRLTSSILLGMALGVCGGFLLNSVVQGAPFRPFYTIEKVLFTATLILLVLGIGGGELIQGAGRRISKLSFGGAEIAFVAPAKHDTGRSRSAPPPSQFTPSTLNSAVLPIDLFSYLPGFIRGDAIYIQKAGDIEEAREKSRSPPSTDEKAALSRAKQTKELLVRLDAASNFTRTMFWPIGVCLATIFNQTGDTIFVTRTLDNLLAPLADITLPAHPEAPAAFATKTDEALFLIFRKLFIYTYDRTYRVADRKGLSERAAEALDVLQHYCLPVTYMVCTKESWDAINTKIGEFYPWLPIDQPRERRKKQELRKVDVEIRSALPDCCARSSQAESQPWAISASSLFRMGDVTDAA